MRIPLILLMLLALATAARAQQPAPSAQKPSTDAQKPAPAAQKPASRAASADTAFATKAAQANIAEIELGKVAADKAMRDEVKKFGQMMVDDHSKALDELKMIAAQKNVTLPTETDKEHKTLHGRLSKLSGAEFDRAYMQAMVDGHKKVAADVRKESTSGSDADVKAWAAKVLPTVEAHLKQAETINRGTHTSSTAHK